MSQRNKFEIAEKIIISLSSKLRTFKNESSELIQFIRELESINFSLTHELTATKHPSNAFLALLNSIHLNFCNKLIDDLDHKNLAEFTWMNIYDGLETNQLFINGMFVSRLLGLDGYFASNRISVGLMLIMPGVTYPFHTHIVKEFYYCLSGKLFIQHDIDGEMFSLGEGEISITPEGKLHSLEVIGNKPVLLVYSWLGDLNAPIRIWEKMKSGSWDGCIWRRLPGQKWKRSDLQKLSNKDFLNLFSKYS